MPTSSGAFTFDEVLPRLTVAYELGRLVPFVGVGMSRPGCASWEVLVGNLEREADIRAEPPTKCTKPEELIRRANQAVKTLRAKKAGAFGDALRRALFATAHPVPTQMQALARIWWPLVLTTNYDDFYVKAFAEAFDARTLAVVGRGSEDCQRVLTSLTVAGRALLWALQGHLASPCAVTDHEGDARLCSELVIDHDEYRRVTYREPHFRRAFGEVFRTRSLFFLGSGLKESYIQELLGEVLELYGPSTRPHYAIMPAGEVDPRFMFARFQIAVVEYESTEKFPNHGYVPARLEDFRGAVERVEGGHVSWGVGAVSSDGGIQRGRVELEVVRGPLPTERRVGECLVVSAGGRLDGEAFFVSPELRPTVKAWCGGTSVVPTQLSEFVAEYVGHDAFAVRARPEHDDVKSLVHVRRASEAVFATVASRFQRIHMQLLASGGEDHAGATSWDARPYPARFSFMETVRGWGNWRRTHPDRDVNLVLHVVDLSVTREIASGRIDVLELLNCPDICVWTEQVEGGILVERRRFQLDDATPLSVITSELCLDVTQWDVEVSPQTRITAEAARERLDGRREGHPLTTLPLHALGVVAGSTLHFHRIEAHEGPVAAGGVVTT